MLAGGGKLGPIAGYRGIQLQLAFGHQLQGGDSGERFGAGKQVGDGVAVPGFMAILVGGTGPQIDHRATTHLDAQRRAALLGIIEQRRERFTHRLELKFIMALNLHP
ncbi:hypothetical protein D3C76_1425000 [compost metagenome]